MSPQRPRCHNLPAWILMEKLPIQQTTTQQYTKEHHHRRRHRIRNPSLSLLPTRPTYRSIRTLRRNVSMQKMYYHHSRTSRQMASLGHLLLRESSEDRSQQTLHRLEIDSLMIPKSDGRYGDRTMMMIPRPIILSRLRRMLHSHRKDQSSLNLAFLRTL